MTDRVSPPCTLTARWVIPVARPPLERGTVTVGGGHILAVEPHGSRSPDLDLGNAALLPGLVNAHTHLDLGGLRGRVAPTEDFCGWLRAVIDHRRALSPAEVEAAVRGGIAECLSFGTTLVGDISGQGLSWALLADSPIKAVVFYELLGLPRTRASAAWAAARSWLRSHLPTDTCRPGLSPHAPYSVRSSLYRAIGSLATKLTLPVTTHLAESRAELELLHSHGGPFVDFLTELGVWDPEGLVDEPEEVPRLCARVAHLLLAHGTYLRSPATIPPSGTVVYCPRTHAAFGHEPHPFRAYMAAGVRVALGTDSLASNPDLDVLGEARFLHQLYPEVGGDILLRMATLAGAEALGWQLETGSLEPGKSADLVVCPLLSREAADPFQLVLESSSPVQAVMCRGVWVDLVGQKS